jgi:fatty-acyl-CoA synthase
MKSLMMDYPLTLTHILERAAKLFPGKEIASRKSSGMHRYTYSEFYARVHRLAHALTALGIKPGDRVGTLAWNGHRHLEAYFAVPCMGAILHTLNLRLASDQLAYIINHAGDRIILVDESLLPVIDAIRGDIPGVERIVVMPEAGGEYEELLASAPAEPFEWPVLEENTACATCYTSGTTGNPKGVVYSHRAIFLHSYGLCLADSFAISERDTILQIVPMFHANGWGIPFAAVMAGSRLVLCGRSLQPEDIAHTLESERVTFTAGVPTIWMTLYSHLETHPRDLSSIRMISCAGSALPRQFIEWYAKKYGVQFRLAWGMTETTPIATFLNPKTHLAKLPEDEWFDLLARHGSPLAGVDVRIVGDDRKPLPWDGTTMGELQVRGPWVASGYHDNPDNSNFFQDGWFRTGDVATIDREGYIQIMDRTKDLVKSGGEWIASVDLENAIMAHPKVMEAAVIAVFHPKWQERPLACIVPKPEHAATLTKEEILEFLSARVVKWWLPDEIEFIEAVPKTSVGKFNKRALREQFKDYTLPELR